MLKKISLLTIQFEVPPSSEKIAGGFQQAGKKEGGWGEGIFARLPKRSPAALPEALRAESSKNIFFSLIENILAENRMAYTGQSLHPPIGRFFVIIANDVTDVLSRYCFWVFFNGALERLNILLKKL
ncbi:hypothetical protein KJ978_03700, partial [Patescibacteria group bacterium]|nr:hypothetical protein [Patescibacteria group bacterium]